MKPMTLIEKLRNPQYKTIGVNRVALDKEFTIQVMQEAADALEAYEQTNFKEMEPSS